MFLKKYVFDLVMVIEKRFNSLPVYSYACNKLYNNLWSDLVRQLRLSCNRQGEEIVVRRL